MALTIRLKTHGPYLISADDAAGVTIVDAEGNRCMPEPGRSIALCRCGGSAKKPFCDGTHRRNGFVGTPTQCVGTPSAPPGTASGRDRA